MRDLFEVACQEDPSSLDKKLKNTMEYKLPEDPDEEKKIIVNGLSTDELIDMCFQGIDLLTYAGEYFTRSLLVSTINSAIATAEQLFDIALSEKVIENELHDYEGYKINSYGYTNLFYRPIKKITNMHYCVGNNKVLDMPLNWVQVDKKGGSITILPMSGAIQPITPALYSAMPFYGTFQYLPMGISISYIAGMDKKDIPYNLLEYIYKKAAISVFEVWGDQIIGAGIASSSLSVDGLSQSIGTTQSAMYGGASARILEYRKDIDELVPILRKHYAKINSVVL